MKRSFARYRFGPAAALAAMVALGVWAVAVEPPPTHDDDPLLMRIYPLDFTRTVDLQQMQGNPDEAIVEAYIRQREYSGPFFGLSDQQLAAFDRAQTRVGRMRVRPGGELQIVIVVGAAAYCTTFYGCPGVVLAEEDGKWGELTGFFAMHESGFAVATRPFWMRARLDPRQGRQEIDHGPKFLAQPVNDGRPTFVGPNNVIYWTGTEWHSGCWRSCESR
jgi:hypothetical protein